MSLHFIASVAVDRDVDCVVATSLLPLPAVSSPHLFVVLFRFSVSSELVALS